MNVIDLNLEKWNKKSMSFFKMGFYLALLERLFLKVNIQTRIKL
ncbi:Uncharacterised protein [Mycoplasmoides pneumoniae]|uniref:Uncharacterized protein n=1 Tax=Mycoplasmoides pneumoniae TaxID=2104 RepID=A0AB38W9U5_MYCPM|nr:Uncharacterised protein [Mycoplasmoides pneumoniae]